MFSEWDGVVSHMVQRVPVLVQPTTTTSTLQPPMFVAWWLGLGQKGRYSAAAKCRQFGEWGNEGQVRLVGASQVVVVVAAVLQ